MRSLFAKAAQRRMQQRDDGYEPERLSEAQQEFFEALIERDLPRARRANGLIAQYSPRRPPPARAEQENRAPCMKALLAFVAGLQQQRLDEKRGVARPERSPDQFVEGAVVLDRFKRWMAGDDSAGPFEVAGPWR